MAGARIVAVLLFLLTWAEGQDGLDVCSEKPGSGTGCSADAAVACWSRDPTVRWTCWTRAMVPTWASHSLTANAACQTLEDSLGQRSYSGACSFKVPGLRFPMPRVPSPRSWDESYALAERLLPLMTLEEKQRLLQGIGWNGAKFELNHGYYVGTTRPVDRLAVPGLNFQDAADGFRMYWEDMVGTSTCWPSQLSMAATWDEDALLIFGVALGKEFATKGASASLGPGVNVHRVARNGRNFEYLSGEDPHLGAKLGAAHVRGVQSQGVMAVVKHFAMNEQETNRNTESSNVDEKTAWDLYFPPFQAAVDAGAVAFMCSYNLVDGVHACSNRDLLRVALKERMGFRGFVQSDWWAAHEMSLERGLDQEMPGTQGLYSIEALRLQPPELLDDAVRRILAAMNRLDLMSTSKCSPPNCTQYLRANVTSPENRALSRELATQSIVLLQNHLNVLPLSNVTTIAVVGAAAVARPYDPSGKDQGANAWAVGDYYSGGGSGHTVASNVVTPLEGIQRRAQQQGITVLSSTTNDPTSALQVAKQADVTIIVAATTCGESADRQNLSLDGGADDLIATVSAAAKRTVVLVQAPGAVVMPWKKSVQAILVLFLGGEETGSAWGRILFGDEAPSGRLPIMMPETEADSIPPSQGLIVDYSEGLRTSYRNPNFTAAFPFGHGLTYTSFEYRDPILGNCSLEASAPLDAFVCLRLAVDNVGPRAGRTVVQSYLEMPAQAGYPTPILRGFRKTGMIPAGGSESVLLHFTARDLSFYEPLFQRWIMPGSLRALVGESSRDIKLSIPMRIPQAAGGSPNPSRQWTAFWWLIAVLAAIALIVPFIFYAVMRRRPDGMVGMAEDSSSELSEFSG